MIKSKKPKRKGYPWKCNFCGGKLMFYSILEFNSELRKQLAEYANLKGNEIFKVQKCENIECGRTFIFIEPPQTIPLHILQAYDTERSKITKEVFDSLRQTDKKKKDEES